MSPPFHLHRAALPALLVLLSGCARTMAPAPVEFHTRDNGGVPAAVGERTPAIVAAPNVPHPDRVTVGRGDTLYGVSRRYGVPVRSIIDANALQPPYRLAANSTLVLPQVRVHIVRPGDTLLSVSRLYGVESSTLAATNHLTPPFVVRNGETLVLPAPVETARALPQPAPAAPSPPAFAAAPLPPPPPSLPPPASPEPVAESSPVPLPPMPPARAVISPSPHAAPAIVAEIPRPPAAKPPEPVMEPVEKPIPIPASLPPRDQPEKDAVLPSGKGFIWPVRGHVINAYGPADGGMQNDGINIVAPRGTPVLAAAAGEVKYAGNELRGYGYLVLIKHADGFITAYAHNEQLLVKRGDRVRRGQVIAKVGATGAVNEPQLHFEIRRGSHALDPEEYLPAAKATAVSG